MTDSNQSTGTGGGQGSGDTGATQSQTIVSHMTSNKVEACLWMSRLFTIVCTILFFVPILGGGSYGFYQRALISNAVTSVLRLHQRLPNIQLNRAFMMQLLAEDSAHYVMFSLIFINSSPLSMSLMPIFLYALLHACNYTKILLNIMGPTSLQFVRNMITKLQGHQVHILRFIACTEIFMVPAVVVMTFSGKSSIFLPFIYYKYITLRYTSMRNPYCRTLFYELRVTIEHVIMKPQCPQFLRNMTHKAIAVISRLAPAMAA